MKVTLSIAALLSLVAEIGHAQSSGHMDTCADQAPCLTVTVTEIEAQCESGSCEYEVCWSQTAGGVGRCEKWGDVVHVGDMHRFRSTDFNTTNPKTGGCLNEENKGGKGYWDEECADPSKVYSDGVAYEALFEKVCQVLPPGHTTHLLIYDGASCSVDHYGSGLTAQIFDPNSDITAYCSPSTQDQTNSNPGGKTYFLDPEDPSRGGTCSTLPEGEECVWSITVPDTCWREETHCASNTGENQNADTLCKETTDSSSNKRLLEYYDNKNNGAPPKPAIHDIALHNNGTVSFRVMNPFGSEFHDLYAVYPKPGAYDNWNEVCAKEQSASECTNDVVLNAQCLHASKAFTLVTVFVAGYSDTASAAALINGNSAGNNIFSCCPTDNEPYNQIQSSHVSAFTYLIHCGCGGGESQEQGSRLLRAEHYVDEARAREISEAFHNGELFDDQLKELHGLN